jgi:hypothetical protein
MDKPRIFLGSSGKQEKLLQALARGLEDVAHVEPWTTSFNPGTTTLERLLELAHEVDFAAFVFARDDWTTISPPASDPMGSGQASPRDNVVFEAGLVRSPLTITHRPGSSFSTTWSSVTRISDSSVASSSCFGSPTGRSSGHSSEPPVSRVAWRREAQCPMASPRPRGIRLVLGTARPTRESPGKFVERDAKTLRFLTCSVHWIGRGTRHVRCPGSRKLFGDDGGVAGIPVPRPRCGACRASTRSRQG